MNTIPHSATKIILACIALVFALKLQASCRGAADFGILDSITFANAGSEKSHALVTTAAESKIDRGGLGEPMRRLLPLSPETWEGGRLAFKMRIDPARQNYVTARFWGDESDENLLILFCEGKQVGYRHLGDIDILALGDTEPRYNGRFYYVTTPLPMSLTRGKTEVSLEIRSTGRIWGYGGNFEQYQKPMTKPSRGIYRLYTHTEGSFVPPSDEKQGTFPQGTLRQTPGPEILRDAKERVTKAVDGLLNARDPINQMQMQFLARACFVKWTPAYQNPDALRQIIRGADERYRVWKNDPHAAWNDKATWNPGWFGLGPCADAIRILAPRLASELGKKLPDSPDGKTRRAAYSEMFQASREWLRRNRRWLTNQAMFTDTNIYLSDRAVAAIDPANALPEKEALSFLYQCIGLEPWLGNLLRDGTLEKPFGDSFYQNTSKGLTRERGYTGGYGEVGCEGVMEIYAATCPAPANLATRLSSRNLQKCCAHAPASATPCSMQMETVPCGSRQALAGATRTSPATSSTPSVPPVNTPPLKASSPRSIHTSSVTPNNPLTTISSSKPSKGTWRTKIFATPSGF